MDLCKYKRDLPHWRLEGSVYFITWRIHSAQHLLTDTEKDLVTSIIEHFASKRFRLYAYVVMHNHVHAVLAPLPGFSLDKIVQGWKSYSANRLQREHSRQGAVWQREYMDRIVRNEDELYQTCEYVLNNPYKQWPELNEYPWAVIGQGW